MVQHVKWAAERHVSRGQKTRFGSRIWSGGEIVGNFPEYAEDREIEA